MKNRTRFTKSALLAASSFFIGSSCFAIEIPDSYGTAAHETTYWQELATPSQNDDLGVFRSVDDGANWGREALSAGQTVRFQFNLHKEHVGTHYADFLKAWLDWDKSGTFEEDETIIFAKQLLPADPLERGTHKTPSVADFVFESVGFIIGESHIGDLWLRARVTCSESLNFVGGGSWNDQWGRSDDSYNALFTPTVGLHQGEVEEHNIAVPDASSTVVLLGGALFGLALIRRRDRR